MTTPPATATREGNTLVLTINRPDARNAVNADVAKVIGEALAEADRDPSVWCIVLTGTGDKAFCAGADLKAIARGEQMFAEGQASWSFAGFANHFTSKPTIAAVNGLAYGGGFELVLAADLAVAVESARFALPEVKRGLIAAAGGAFRVADQLPRKVAMHLLMTGEPISAETALHHGLINAVVPDGQALDSALELAATITENSPTAVQSTKRIAYHARAHTWDGEADRWALTLEENLHVRESADGQEGPRAFAEKRKPVWSGQ